MAIKTLTDPNGRLIRKWVPDTKNNSPEEDQVKKTVKEAPKGTTAKKPAPAKTSNAPKPAFKATIMAVNGDNTYVKKSQQELEDEAQIKNAFLKWLASGATGEFFAIRRK